MTLILSEILKQKGISATQLEQDMNAKGYKLSRISIGNILNDKHSPKVETLEQIAETLGINVTELFSGNSESMEAIYTKDADGNFNKVGSILKRK